MQTIVTQSSKVSKKSSKPAKKSSKRQVRECNYYNADPMQRQANDLEISRQLEEYGDVLFA